VPYLDVGLDRLFYARRVRGQPINVLFVHGAGGRHQIWGHQLQHLKAANTYALDLPGHGQSGGDGRRSIEAYRDVVVAFLDAAGLERTVLVGHSMGGAITQSFALSYPERLDGIVLVGTGARLRVLPAILDGLSSNFAGTVQLITGHAYSQQADPELVAQGQAELLDNRPEVVHGDFLACDRFDLMARVSDISVPTLVICGVEDALTPPRYAAFLHEAVPQAKLTLIDGAGHMVMLEQPEATTQAIARFLRTSMSP